MAAMCRGVSFSVTLASFPSALCVADVGRSSLAALPLAAVLAGAGAGASVAAAAASTSAQRSIPSGHLSLSTVWGVSADATGSPSATRRLKALPAGTSPAALPDDCRYSSRMSVLRLLRGARMASSFSLRSASCSVVSSSVNSVADVDTALRWNRCAPCVSSWREDCRNVAMSRQRAPPRAFSLSSSVLSSSDALGLPRDGLSAILCSARSALDESICSSSVSPKGPRRVATSSRHMLSSSLNIAEEARVRIGAS
mmetsp:Transcript_50819/g.119102  ORF Transcript_50819/g.119102 Transcript_50819/m.119102 type:complete len:255 (+) Transcript_50819:200-964(+)